MGRRSNPFSVRRNVQPVDEVEIRFTDREVAQILWVLSDAADLADSAHALSTLAMIEDTPRMVRDKFERRGPE